MRSALAQRLQLFVQEALAVCGAQQGVDACGAAAGFRAVEFHAFEGNRLEPGGKKKPISRNGYKFAVSKGANFARAWRNSGLSMVKTR